MRIGTDLKGQIARLFQVLIAGERLAQECAHRQAVMAPDRKMRHFLATQAKQEGFHAQVFQRAASALAARAKTFDSPALSAIKHFRERLFADLDSGNLAGSVVGMQVVLEGMGTVVLKEMDMALSRHGDRFVRLRRTFLQQEQAHHAFGLRSLERLCADEHVALPPLVMAGREYLELSGGIGAACAELFQSFGADPRFYQPDLPPWLSEGSS
jgi:hypothetical protein